MSSIFLDIILFVVVVLVVAMSAGIIVAIIYFVGIMRNLKELSETAKREMRAIIKDLDALRKEIKSEFTTWKGISELGLGLVDRLGKAFVRNSVEAKPKNKKVRVKVPKEEATTPEVS